MKEGKRERGLPTIHLPVGRAECHYCVQLPCPFLSPCLPFVLQLASGQTAAETFTAQGEAKDREVRKAV